MNKVKKQVMWSPEEKLAVAVAFRDLVAAGEKRSSGTLNKATLQAIPDISRQRKFATLKGSEWINTIIQSVGPAPIRVATEVEVPCKYTGVFAEPVYNLPLPTRSYNFLLVAQIKYIGDLVQMNEVALRKVHGIGAGILAQIKEALLGKNKGLYLGMIIETTSPEVVHNPLFQEKPQMTMVDMFIESMRPSLEIMAKQMADVMSEVMLRSVEVVKESIKTSLAEKANKGGFVVDVNKVRTKKLKVVTVGPYSKEATRMMAIYGEKLHLENWNKDKSLQELEGMLSHADEVVVMTDHCSHAATDMIKSKHGKYTPVSGGYTSINSVLSRLSQ